MKKIVCFIAVMLLAVSCMAEAEWKKIIDGDTVTYEKTEMVETKMVYKESEVVMHMGRVDEEIDRLQNAKKEMQAILTKILEVKAQ